METIKTNFLHQCYRRLITKSHAPIAIPVITFLCLFFLGDILINNDSMMDVEAQAMRQKLAKLGKDLEELRQGGNQTWTLEQYRRKERIRKVCEKYGNPRDFQQVKNFIMDPKVGKLFQRCLMYCTSKFSERNHLLLQP